MGTTELAIVAGIALLIFGPSQLPRLFKGLGESFREMRSAAKELTGDEEKKK